MRVRGQRVEILRPGTDYQDWRLGIQLAINGQVAMMFDLHKSLIEQSGDGTPQYEEMLYDLAAKALATQGPVKPGVPAASPR